MDSSIPVRQSVSRAANAMLKPFNMSLVRRSTWDTLHDELGLAPFPDTGSGSPEDVPVEVANQLRPDHPDLVALRNRYRALDHPATHHAIWTEEYVRHELDLRRFRSDNAYIWQVRDMNTRLHYLLTAYYCMQIDPYDLLHTLREDGLFGAYTVPMHGEVLVSRDLLDSIVEILFLDRHLNIRTKPGIRVLDIGAGYGRLAYRMATGLPELGHVYCADAVPESTFLCDFYLGFRGVRQKATAVALDEIQASIEPDSIDVAIAVHSLSECSFETVQWWMHLLASRRVRHFMVVTHALRHGAAEVHTRERDGRRIDLRAAIEQAGYRLQVQEPKYLRSEVQEYGVTPTHHYLFTLES